jgi:hypothetical protein
VVTYILIVRDHARLFVPSSQSLCVLSVSAFTFVLLYFQLAAFDFRPSQRNNSFPDNLYPTPPIKLCAVNLLQKQWGTGVPARSLDQPQIASLISQISGSLESASYVLPILQALCFDIHACKWGCGYPHQFQIRKPHPVHCAIQRGKVE